MPLKHMTRWRMPAARMGVGFEFDRADWVRPVADVHFPGAVMTPHCPPSTSRLLTLVESEQRLTHHLRPVDESTPTCRARPAGVLGAEALVKLVDSDSPWPTDPAVLKFLTISARMAASD